MRAKRGDEERVQKAMARIGLMLTWSPVNQAYFIMEYYPMYEGEDRRKVLSVKNELAEVEQWLENS